jgi:hypothetical protein
MVALLQLKETSILTAGPGYQGIILLISQDPAIIRNQQTFQALTTLTVLSDESVTYGFDVVRGLKFRPIRLVIADIDSRGWKNCFDLFYWMKRHKPVIPCYVMGVSGELSIGQRLAVRRLNNHFLEKPLTKELLYRVLTKHELATPGLSIA